MHFHHRHDIAGCTDDHDDYPAFALALLATLDRKLEQIMAAQQAELDAATAAINALVAKVGELEAAQAPALDSSALDAAVAAADAVLNPAPTPPASPVVDGGSASDTSGSAVDGGGASGQSAPVPSVPLA